MSGDYGIGYRKPPQATRFKKGQSGNPKGRPKGTSNLKSDLLDELQERVHIREGTSRTQVSKQRAIVKRLIAKSINGDPRSMNIALNLMLRVLEPCFEDDPGEPLGEQEREILETLKARLVKRLGANDGTAPVERDSGQAD